MKTLNKSVFTLIATILFLNSSGQTTSIIDTVGVIYTAKMNFLAFDNIAVSKRFLAGFLKYTPEYTFIKSDGFDKDIVFFKITCRPFEDTSLTIRIGDLLQTPVYYNECNEDGYFAYVQPTGNIYRLQGFRESDFRKFYNDVLWVSSNLHSSKQALRNKKAFINSYYIEGVNMAKLFDCLPKLTNWFKSAT